MSHVVQKAFVEVNEEGTKAAAASAAVLTGRTLHVQPAFVLDRPFLFAILDKHAGLVLFSGRVVNPQQA